MSEIQQNSTLELSREEMQALGYKVVDILAEHFENLWMSIKIFGLEAFREAVTRGFSLAGLAEEILLTSAYWEITSSAQLGIVTFRFVPEDHILAPAELDALNQQIVDKMIADGFAMISTTSLRGRIVLRLCTINPRTTEEDIRDTIRKLETFGCQLTTAK